MDPDVLAFGNVMQIIVVSTACFVAIGLGARILWRWGSRIKPSSTIRTEDRDDRLRHLETAVDAIAIEVERISEAQRFVVGLLAESSQARNADRAELPLSSQKPVHTNTPH
jgi:hypothetical protein